MRRASSLFERFTGHAVESVTRVKVPDIKGRVVVAAIGKLDFVGYTTVRDGEVEKYIHKFRESDKPILCVSPDGRHLYLIGGRYTFTERGIVDLSDRKNLPAKYRRER